MKWGIMLLGNEKTKKFIVAITLLYLIVQSFEPKKKKHIFKCRMYIAENYI